MLHVFFPVCLHMSCIFVFCQNNSRRNWSKNLAKGTNLKRFFGCAHFWRESFFWMSLSLHKYVEHFDHIEKQRSSFLSLMTHVLVFLFFFCWPKMSALSCIRLLCLAANYFVSLISAQCKDFWLPVCVLVNVTRDVERSELRR